MVTRIANDITELGDDAGERRASTAAAINRCTTQLNPGKLECLSAPDSEGIPQGFRSAFPAVLLPRSLC